MATSGTGPTEDEITASEQEAIRRSKELQDTTDSIRDDMVKIVSLFNDQVNMASELTAKMKSYKSNMREVSLISTNIKDLSKDVLSINSRIGNESISNGRMQKLINDQLNISKILDEERLRAQGLETKANETLKTEKGKVRLLASKDLIEAQKLIETIDKNIASNDKVRDILLQQQSIVKGINDLKEEEERADKRKRKEAEERTERLKEYAHIYGLIAKIPIVGPLLDAEKVWDAIRDKSQSVFGEIGRQLKEANPSQMLQMGAAAFSKLKSIMKDLVDVLFKMDTNITNMANGLGLSKDAVAGMVSEMSQAGNMSKELSGVLDQSFLSITNISQAAIDLQESFGTNAMFSKSALDSQVLLTKQMGFTNEEASGIQKMSFLTGKSVKDILDTSLKQGKSNMSYKKVLLELSKVNSEISTSYKNQAGALVNAIKLAGQYGMTLEDTRKVADSLLNFESSIEGELKAELLLGKQLYFEKARALALDGKSAEAAAEVVKQFGGANKLAEQNVIVRKAAAESIGLSAEELTKFAQQQKILNDLGVDSQKTLEARATALKEAGKYQEYENMMQEINRKTGSNILSQDIAKASLNARYEASITRIKEIFADTLAGPLTGFVKVLGNLLSHTTFLKTAFYGFVGVLTAIVALTAQMAFNMAIATGGMSLLGAGIIGGLGALGVMYMGSSAYEGAPSAASPALMTSGASAVSPQGQTNRTSRSSAYPTTANTTGLASSGDNSDVVSELRALRNDMKRGGSVNIDSVRSGTAYGMSRTIYA